MSQFNNTSITKNKNFLILWLGQMVSQLGNHLFRFAYIIWIIKNLNTTSLATILMITSIPGIIFGPIAGTVVDTIDRKKIIYLCDFSRGILALLTAYLMYLNAFSTLHIYIILIIFNLVQTLFNPAIPATLPDIVHEDHLSQANSVRQVTSSFTGMMGPTLAGILYTVLGGGTNAIPILVTINGLSFILSGISELFLNLPNYDKPINSNVKETIKVFSNMLIGGLKYIWDSSFLVKIFSIFAIINFCITPLMSIIIPSLVIDVFEINEIWLGLIQSGLAIGFLLSSTIFSFFKSKNHFKILINSIYALGCFVALFGILSGIPNYLDLPVNYIMILLIIVNLFIGISSAVANIQVATIMQRIVPKDKRGRVFAFLNTFADSISPLSLGISGLIATFAPLFIQPFIGGISIGCSGYMLHKLKKSETFTLES